MIINVKKLREGAHLPKLATSGAAACDLYALLDEPITLAPMQSTFALLCTLVILAEKVSEQRAALIPRCLFAHIDIPIPVPQIRIPKAVSSSA